MNTTQNPLHFCITHKELEIPLLDHLILLEIGEAGQVPNPRGNTVVNCYREMPDARPYRKKLGAMLGVFAARHYLSKTYDAPDFSVNFATYRTFILQEKIEENFHKGMQMNLVTPEGADSLRDKMLPADTDVDWLLPQPLTVASIGAQYTKAHHIEDLEAYIEIAVDEAVLAADEVTTFLDSKILLPGCFGVSLMPASVFCDIGEKLERISLRFLEGFSTANRDNYQIRAVDFCCERLGGYLITKHLMAKHGALPPELFGYWTRVSPDLVPTSGVMSD